MSAPLLPLLLPPKRLAERLPDACLRLVDLRPQPAFQAGHIAGATRADAALLNRQAPPVAGLLPDLAMAHRLFEALQLREGQQVVAIDAGASTEAARLGWVLGAWSVDNVAWLDGGMAAWVAQGLPVVGDASDDPPNDAPLVAPLVAPALRGANLVSADELLVALDDPELRILDVRSAAEFEGSDVRSAMGGHVPGARHYEWTRQLDEHGRLRNPDALRADLAALRIEPEHRVVVYCQSHQRSALTWRVLTALGYDRVQALDGAWSSWGNRADLPKLTGPD